MRSITRGSTKTERNWKRPCWSSYQMFCQRIWAFPPGPGQHQTFKRDIVFNQVFEFINNPYEFWKTGNLKQKRIVQNMVFTERLRYESGVGFGTAELSIPFNILADKNLLGKEMVEPRSTILVFLKIPLSAIMLTF